MKKLSGWFLLFFALQSGQAFALPPDFVYLRTVDPSIIQEMRYYSQHNFIGKPVKGYHAGECILTREAALALKKVQEGLKHEGLSLKVYDCYRPQEAVNEFIRWSQDPRDQVTKDEFYPRVNKAEVFVLGYVVAKSGHSRGSTMDLTIVPLPQAEQGSYHPGQKLQACYNKVGQRFRDNSLDMGTGYDCMDESAHLNYWALTPLQIHNRLLLSERMQEQGFKPYDKEWWHFTLRAEPFPETYFDFPVS